MSATVFRGEVKYTKRYRLGQLLSILTRHFLLMLATPHNGKEADFQLFTSWPCWMATASDWHGERSETGRPPVGVGPEAAKAVCKRIRDAVKPFAQWTWRGAAARRRARAVLTP